MDETYELAKALGEAQNDLNAAQSQALTLRDKLRTTLVELDEAKQTIARLEQMNANLDNLLQEYRIQGVQKPKVLPQDIDKG